MRVRITPTPLEGAVAVPASKSHAHRLLMAAALANKPTDIAGLTSSDDIVATVESLQQLGARIERLGGGRWRVIPWRGPLARLVLLNCRESAATLRLLLPLAGGRGADVFFTGTGRLPQRPLAPLREALERNGLLFSAPGIPFTVSGKLNAGTFALPGDVSSQFVSGLLLALPRLRGDSEIILTSPLESAGYVAMTLAEMARFGVSVTPTARGWRVPGRQRYRSPGVMTVEGDWSAAAVWLAAGALGQGVSVSGLDPASLQPDRRVMALLQEFGAQPRMSDGVCSVGAAELRAVSVDVSATPDLTPLLAALGTAAAGTTVITGAARLRSKESDRLRSMAAGLARLGANLTETADGLCIEGGAPLTGGRVDSFGDHRVAMALALAALRCTRPVTIKGAGAVNKSYPSFWDDYQRLGGKIDVL